MSDELPVVLVKGVNAHVVHIICPWEPSGWADSFKETHVNMLCGHPMLRAEIKDRRVSITQVVRLCGKCRRDLDKHEELKASVDRLLKKSFEVKP